MRYDASSIAAYLAASAASASPPQWCTFHRTASHRSDECHALRSLAAPSPNTQHRPRPADRWTDRPQPFTMHSPLRHRPPTLGISYCAVCLAPVSHPGDVCSECMRAGREKHGAKFKECFLSRRCRIFRLGAVPGCRTCDVEGQVVDWENDTVMGCSTWACVTFPIAVSISCGCRGRGRYEGKDWSV